MMIGMARVAGKVTCSSSCLDVLRHFPACSSNHSMASSDTTITTSAAIAFISFVLQ